MRIQPPDRRQGFLLPPSIDDFVGPTHRVRVIVEVVERLDLSRFGVGEDETGRPAYPPHTLVSLLFYAFSIGVFSAREMERRLKTDCAFMYAASGLRPSYRTIARFRARYQEELAELFAQVVAVCRRAGLGHTNIVAIDGTRQRANASMDAHVREEQLEKELERVRKDMRRLLEKAAQVDDEEDQDPDAGGGDGGVPKELEDKRKREAAIEKALGELAEAGQKEANRTDPEARLQRFREGSRPGYNAQLAVSGEDGLILACEVVPDAGDTRQLIPLCDQVKENTGEDPGVVVADAGYESGESFRRLAERGQDAVVASACAKSRHKARERSGLYQWVDFEYDETSGEYICPAGQRLVPVKTVEKAEGRKTTYEGTACVDCGLKSACTKKEVKRLGIMDTTRYLAAMSKRRQRDRQHDRLGARRKVFVEGRFGHMKHNLKWRQFMRRGVAACRSEFRLLCAAIDLSKLARWLDLGNRRLAEVLST